MANSPAQLVSAAPAQRTLPPRVNLRVRLVPEGVVLGLLTAWTLVPIVILLTGKGVYNGGFGLDVPDLMQYMGFIRDAGGHLLISNRFDVVSDPHLFLDPVFAISGLVWRLGASIQFSLLMWVPVVLVTLVAGWGAYARRLLGPARGPVIAALLLAFFFLTPSVPLAQWLHSGASFRFSTEVIGLEMFAGGYAWGGGPALAIAVMPAFLLALERLLDPARRAAGRSARWYATWAAAAGLVASWVHPWQGITLMVILVGLVAWGRFHRRYLALVVPAVVTAAPLLYYVALSHTNSSWQTVSRATSSPHFGWWLLAGVAPAVLALPGFPGRGLDLQERMLRLWPLAGFVTYLALDRTWFYHALASLSLPLAILAVRGWRTWRMPRLAAVAAAIAITVPGLVWVVQQLVDGRSQYFFQPSEAQALQFLNAARQRGAVLAPPMPLGQAVPAFTGRQTYVGHYEWTPNYFERAALTDELFDGRLAQPQAVELVRNSTATFLASDCSPGRVDLRQQLGPLILHTWRFGCATVYEVRR